MSAPSELKKEWNNHVDQALEHAAYHERRWIETADCPQLRCAHETCMKNWWARALQLDYWAKTSNG